MKRATLAALLTALVLSVQARAGAADEHPDSVSVVITAASDPALEEYVRRVAAELRASGFPVETGGCAPRLHPDCARPWPSDITVVAAVQLAWAEGGIVVEARAAGRQNSPVIQCDGRVSGAPPDPSVVAVRATELVRAGTIAAMRGEPTPLPRAVAGPTSSPEAFVELGPALVRSFGGIGSAWGPKLGAGLIWRRQWLGGVWLAAPAWGGEVSTSAGRATLRSALGGLELGRVLFVASRVRPTVTAGLGVYHLQASGQDVAPFTPTTAGLWTALGSVSAGATLPLLRRWTLHADARAVFVKTSAAVRIAGDDAGQVGRPLLVLGLSLAFQP